MEEIGLYTGPRLGEMSAVFSLLLGAARHVESHGAGVVRWYNHGDAELAVLFDRNRAIAIHFPFRERTHRRELIKLMVSVGATHLLLADCGIIFTTSACPRDAAVLVANLATSHRRSDTNSRVLHG